MKTDTELLEWLIENGAFMVESFGEWLVVRHICDGEFDKIR